MLFWMTAVLIPSNAQPGRPAPAPSPVVNPDNTVTFNYQNEHAKQVMVDVQFAGNAEWFPNEGFKNSLLDMRGDGNLIHALKNVPHGKVDYVNYWSDAMGMFGNATRWVR